jgi:hypothetical protein
VSAPNWWNDKFHDLLVESFVGRANKLDQDLMGAWRELVDDDWLPARIQPTVRAFINRDVEMAKTRRDIERCFTEDGQDPDVVGTVADDHTSLGQLRRNWSICYKPGWSLIFDSDQGHAN